jgi:hypothetical protein
MQDKAVMNAGIDRIKHITLMFRSSLFSGDTEMVGDGLYLIYPEVPEGAFLALSWVRCIPSSGEYCRSMLDQPSPCTPDMGRIAIINNQPLLS